MIFQFARMMRSPSRALPVIEPEAHDAPPEAFVEKLSDEGGDVYVAPVLESLREAVRRHRVPSTGAPEEATPAASPEDRP